VVVAAMLDIIAKKLWFMMAKINSAQPKVKCNTRLIKPVTQTKKLLLNQILE
jgi:hypothetical protein